jgi:hypothetical protein
MKWEKEGVKLEETGLSHWVAEPLFVSQYKYC